MKLPQKRQKTAEKASINPPEKPVAHHFWQCPECGMTGTFAYDPRTRPDIVRKTTCTHRIAVTIPGRTARERMANDADSARIAAVREG